MPKPPAASAATPQVPTRNARREGSNDVVSAVITPLCPARNGGASPGLDQAGSGLTPACVASVARAPVAQRIEHLTTDQKVWGSNPYGRARDLLSPRVKP